MASVNRLRASIIDLTFITWVIAVPLALHPRLLNADGDFPRHVTMGEFILRGGPFQVDTFAHTHTGPFLTTEWLSQIAYALAHRLGGLAGVAALAGIIVGLTYALVVLLMRRSRVESFLAFMAGIIAAILGSPHWVARPHLFTFLGLAILLHLALHGRRWWVFVPFFAVWANFHGGFVLGIALLVVMAAGEWLESRLVGEPERAKWKQRARFHGVGALAGLAAATLNPMGPELLFRIRRILGNDFLLATTAEFQSLDFHQLYGRAYLAVLLLILTILTLRRKRLPLPTLFVVGMTLAGGLVARRNAPLFALIALPLLAIDFDAAWKSLRVRGLERIRRVFEEGEALAVPGRWAPWSGALILLFGATGGAVGGVRLIPEHFDARKFPVQAAAQARSAGLDGNIFNDFVWGGYLLHAWPEQRIFIDGMTDFLGDDVLRSYLTIERLDPGWQEELERFDVSIVIMPPHARLVPALRDREWRTWYEDETAVILLRDTPGP